MNFIEQESTTAEIRNLFDRSPSQGVFLVHLEETTEVMRKSAVLPWKPCSPWQALRGAHVHTLPLPYRRGHSVPRELCSLQHCSDRACFPSPSLWQSPFATAQEHVLLFHSVFPPQSHRLSREPHGADSSRPPGAQIRGWRLWREEGGSW